MASGLFSADPGRNKNKLYLKLITLLIIMITIISLGIFYLERTGYTYREQYVALDPEE